MGGCMNTRCGCSGCSGIGPWDGGMKQCTIPSSSRGAAGDSATGEGEGQQQDTKLNALSFVSYCYPEVSCYSCTA